MHFEFIDSVDVSFSEGNIYDQIDPMMVKLYFIVFYLKCLK